MYNTYKTKQRKYFTKKNVYIEMYISYKIQDKAEKVLYKKNKTTDKSKQKQKEGI